MRSLQRVLNLGQLCLRSLETSATESRGFAVQALQAGASTRCVGSAAWPITKRPVQPSA